MQEALEILFRQLSSKALIFLIISIRNYIILIKINNIQLVPGYFGKLPAYNDFIKLNAAGNEILALDKWLQDGLIYSKNKLKNNLEKFYLDAMPYNFFYPFTGTDNFIIGICFPGMDRSNRIFPFLIFFVLSKDFLKDVPAFYIPVVFNETFSELNKFYTENLNSTDTAELNHGLNKIDLNVSTITIKTLYQDYLSFTSQEKLWQRILTDINDKNILSDEDRETKFICDLLEFKTLKNSSSNFKVDFFAESNYNKLDLSFLLNLIISPKADQNYAFFWSHKNSKIHLYIFKGKLLPVNFLDLIYYNIDDKMLCTNHTAEISFFENKKNNLDQLLQHFIS